MKLNYFVSLLWCLTFLHIVGSQLNGDPAPGRSPGPPTSQANDVTSLESNHHGNDESIQQSSANNAIDYADSDFVVPNKSHENKKVSSTTTTGARRVPTTLKAVPLAPKANTNEFVKTLDGMQPWHVSHKLCKNVSVTEYLLMNTHAPRLVRIEATQPSSTTTHSPIVDVIHSTFDLSHGIVPNVIYTGKSILE